MADQFLPVSVDRLSGLSLKLNAVNRPKNTWQQLDNFDLYVEGSIRKILPATVYAGAFPTQLLQLLEYRAQINYQGGINRLVGVDASNILWDIDGSTSISYLNALNAFTNALADNPYMCQMAGYYVPFNIRNWQAGQTYQLNDAVVKYSSFDGQVYVYFNIHLGNSGTNEPVWTNLTGGTINDAGVVWKNAGILNSNRFRLNWGIIVTKGAPAMKFVEWKYDPTNLTEPYKVNGFRVGVSSPGVPINVTPVVTVSNLNGYAPVSGRAFVWTYYNPNTLHDSSPAPFVGPTTFTDLDLNPVASKVLNGSVLPALPGPTAVTPAVATNAVRAQLPAQAVPFQSYQAYYLEIPASALTTIPYGDGYNSIRCWATKDGGSTFFLMTRLYDANGNLLTDGNGAIGIPVLLANETTGYVPLPTPQKAQLTVRIYDGITAPVQLAPDPTNLGAGSWAVLSGTQMFVVPGAAGDSSGNAAVEYPGPVPASGPQNVFISTAIAVVPTRNYAFQGYINKLHATGGFVSWHIVDAGGQTIAAFDQTDGVAGTVGGTFAGPAGGVVRIVAWIGQSGGINPVVPAGTVVQWASPSLMAGLSISTAPVTYPTPDSSLVTPAPLPGSQEPPPLQCAMGALYAATLFLVDYNNPTRVFYSNQGDFQSYGRNAYLDSPKAGTAPIIEIIEAFDRLLVSGSRFIEQIVSNSPDPGFARLPVDPQHGSVAYKGSIGYGSDVFMLTDAGLAHFSPDAVAVSEPGQQHIAVGFAPESLLSEDIQPILNTINPLYIHVDANPILGPKAVVDNTLDLYYLLFNGNVMVSMPMRGEAQGHFSRITPMPGGGLYTVKEVFLKNQRTYAVLGLGFDNKVYQLNNGTQDGTVTATAVTQPLPTVEDIQPELIDTDKVFESLLMEGNDLPNFSITASLDGGVTFPYGPWAVTQGQKVVPLGLEGRRLTLRFTHNSATSVTPLLSYYRLMYTVIGRSPAIG